MHGLARQKQKQRVYIYVRAGNGFSAGGSDYAGRTLGSSRIHTYTSAREEEEEEEEARERERGSAALCRRDDRD